jgi:hypothetical protein
MLNSITPATRISLSLRDPTILLPDVATLTIGAGPPLSLGGDVRRSLHPATDGTVSTGGVPPSNYVMTVFPASAMSTDAVTTMPLDLTTPPTQPMPMSLSKKVTLMGRLLPAAEAWGTQLVALDADGLPIVSQGSVAADGSFALAVSPGRSYQLQAVPGPDQALARASFSTTEVPAGGLAGQDHDMPAALLFAGRVVDPSLQGVGTALVQAFCLASAACEYPSVPVAETITRSDGTFQLMLPDPGGTP